MTTFHGLLGGGVLGFWGDIDPEHEQQFNEWYTHEHLPERVSIPGFLRGRRYEATDTSPSGQRYLTLYETESVDTLSSEPYLERLNNPTELTNAVVPVIRNMDRAVFRVVTTTGQGIGGFVGSFALTPEDGESQAGERRLIDEVLPRLLDDREVTGAHLLEYDVETTQAKDATAEGRSAGQTSAPAQWVVLVEATHEQALPRAEEALRAEEVFSVGPVARYRLMLSLSE